MKHHPYASIRPMIEGLDFEKLKDDIRANGLRAPIVTYEGLVLDGRARDLACYAIGLNPRYRDVGEITELQAIEMVIALNDRMTKDERAFAGDRLSSILNRLISESEVESKNRAAKMLGTSRPAIARARYIRKNGTPADVADVLSGRYSISRKAFDLSSPRTASTPQPRPQIRTLRLINAPPIKPLTPQDVDPEFVGTPIDFVDKYGHVQIHTAEEYANMRFGSWASSVRALAKYWKQIPDLGRAVDHNWLRSPKAYDVAKMREALEILRPVIAEAEALLATADAAKAQGPKSQHK